MKRRSYFAATWSGLQYISRHDLAEFGAAFVEMGHRWLTAEVTCLQSIAPSNEPVQDWWCSSPPLSGDIMFSFFQKECASRT